MGNKKKSSSDKSMVMRIIVLAVVCVMFLGMIILPLLYWYIRQHRTIFVRCIFYVRTAITFSISVNFFYRLYQL